MTLSALVASCRVAAVALVLVFAAGCPTPSAQPLATDKSRTTDNHVLGGWIYQDNGRDGATATVSEKEGTYYADVDDKGKVTRYPLRLFKVGDATFLEASSTEDDRKTYWLYRIEVGKDDVRLFTWDDAANGELLANKGVTVKSSPSGDRLDMPAEKLHEFLKANLARFSKLDLAFRRKA